MYRVIWISLVEVQEINLAKLSKCSKQGHRQVKQSSFLTRTPNLKHLEAQGAFI